MHHYPHTVRALPVLTFDCYHAAYEKTVNFATDGKPRARYRRHAFVLSRRLHAEP